MDPELLDPALPPPELDPIDAVLPELLPEPELPPEPELLGPTALHAVVAAAIDAIDAIDTKPPHCLPSMAK